MAVLDASRPRVLCLARKVSSLALFVGVLPILMSLLMTEAVAQVPVPGPPIGVTVTPKDRQFTLKWTHPSDISLNDIDGYAMQITTTGNPTSNTTLWADSEPTVAQANPNYTRRFLDNGKEHTVRIRVRRKSSRPLIDAPQIRLEA